MSISGPRSRYHSNKPGYQINILSPDNNPHENSIERLPPTSAASSLYSTGTNQAFRDAEYPRHHTTRTYRRKGGEEEEETYKFYKAGDMNYIRTSTPYYSIRGEVPLGVKRLTPVLLDGGLDEEEDEVNHRFRSVREKRGQGIGGNTNITSQEEERKISMGKVDNMIREREHVFESSQRTEIAKIKQKYEDMSSMFDKNLRCIRNSITENQELDEKRMKILSPAGRGPPSMLFDISPELPLPKTTMASNPGLSKIVGGGQVLHPGRVFKSRYIRPQTPSTTSNYKELNAKGRGREKARTGENSLERARRISRERSIERIKVENQINRERESGLFHSGGDYIISTNKDRLTPDINKYRRNGDGLLYNNITGVNKSMGDDIGGNLNNPVLTLSQLDEDTHDLTSTFKDLDLKSTNRVLQSSKGVWSVSGKKKEEVIYTDPMEPHNDIDEPSLSKRWPFVVRTEGDIGNKDDSDIPNPFYESPITSSSKGQIRPNDYSGIDADLSTFETKVEKKLKPFVIKEKEQIKTKPDGNMFNYELKEIMDKKYQQYCDIVKKEKENQNKLKKMIKNSKFPGFQQNRATGKARNAHYKDQSSQFHTFEQAEKDEKSFKRATKRPGKPQNPLRVIKQPQIKKEKKNYLNLKAEELKLFMSLVIRHCKRCSILSKELERAGFKDISL